MQVPSYNKKDEHQLAWLDNKDSAKLEIKKIARRLENAVFDELAVEFDQAVLEGRVLDIHFDRAYIQELFLRSIRQELSAPE